MKNFQFVNKDSCPIINQSWESSEEYVKILRTKTHINYS